MPFEYPRSPNSATRRSSPRCPGKSPSISRRLTDDDHRRARADRLRRPTRRGRERARAARGPAHGASPLRVALRADPARCSRFHRVLVPDPLRAAQREPSFHRATAPRRDRSVVLQRRRASRAVRGPDQHGPDCSVRIRDRNGARNDRRDRDGVQPHPGTALFPYAVVLQTIPVLALVPLFSVWFGPTRTARVVTCVLVAIFPMLRASSSD